MNEAPNRAKPIYLRVRMEVILAVLCVALAIREPQFRTPENLLTVLRSISMQGLIAFGMTMVIIVGEIDLSVGASVSLAGCFLAWATARGWPMGLGALLTVAGGTGLGAFIGIMRHRYQMPSFITTLALLTGLKGAALLLTGGFPITSFPYSFGYIGSGYVAGIPVPAIILAAAFVGFQLLLSKTGFGRAVYAVGGNPEAARLSGIDPNRIRTHVLAITGGLSAVSGILLASRINSGTPDAAQGWELDVIAAVIIGGTSITGGRGTVWGTLVGILFIGVIANGMTLLNTPPYWQYAIRGALIFAAVLMNRARHS